MTMEKGKETKPAEPEMIALKDVAKQAGVEPREARSILRKIASRAEGDKRQRWQFSPKEVPGVVSKIKNFLAEKEKVKAAREAEKEEE